MRNFYNSGNPTTCFAEPLLKSTGLEFSVSTSIGTKKGRIYGKEAPFNGALQTFGGSVAPILPPGSPTVTTQHGKCWPLTINRKNTTCRKLIRQELFNQ